MMGKRSRLEWKEGRSGSWQPAGDGDQREQQAGAGVGA